MDQHLSWHYHVREATVKSVASAVELVSCSSSSAAVAWVGEMRLNRTSFSYKNSAAATRDCPTDRRGVRHERMETRDTGTLTARSCRERVLQ